MATRTRFVVAQRGVHEDLRQEFCLLREKKYAVENLFEPPGTEAIQYHFDPWDYLLMFEEGKLVGGCVLVNSTPQNKGGKRLTSRILCEGEIEICRNVSVLANAGFRGLFPLYYRIFRYSVDNGVSTAYADIREPFFRMLQRLRLSCIEQLPEPEVYHGMEKCIPVRFTAPAAATFFARHHEQIGVAA